MLFLVSHSYRRKRKKSEEVVFADDEYLGICFSVIRPETVRYLFHRTTSAVLYSLELTLRSTQITTQVSFLVSTRPPTHLDSCWSR